MAGETACPTKTGVSEPSRTSSKRGNSRAPAFQAAIPMKTKTLDRVISKAGLGSRTQARSWIHAGRVRVNGKVVEDPDLWIDFDRDRILFDDKPLESKD